MGEALIRGMINGGVVSADRIVVMEPDEERAARLGDEYHIRVERDPAALAGRCRVLLLAVKPQVVSSVLPLYSDYLRGDHLVISIAAGIAIRTLEAGLPAGTRVIRVMPNTPALVLAGASAFCTNDSAGEEDAVLARGIFSSVGVCLQVNESLLDAVTGLSGSGPAYVFAFIEALTDGGVLAGLPRDIAEKLVLQTVYGAAKLLMETGEPAAVLKGKVTSPGGTTITGLRVLEEAGFRGALMNAVEAAAERSEELGR